MKLDPFQEQAIASVQAGHSVLVAAPTGAGKTLIAEHAIRKAMEKGERVIYTAPIKALSNQKFRDFRALYGDASVGILTGDVSIEPDAPILIMTTEIYRNSLFEDSIRIRETGCVIFDEIHYLDDPERGTVWEEAILFTPAEIRILALSATVPNVEALASWMRSIHHRTIDVIREERRPVPLHFFFQSQGRLIPDMKRLRQEGYLNRVNWRLTPREKRQYRLNPLRARPNRLDPLLSHLVEKNRLPAIYFAFGRRRTETLAWEAMRFDFLSAEEREIVRAEYQDLLDRYDLAAERSALEMKDLIERGIAYHHAGMLPTLKEAIEQLFTRRRIQLIFTTETFALGINMPARSVVFDELSKFYGTGFRNLTNRDFYQMAGRAGRRGMDAEGFVYVRVNPHDIAFPEVERILYGRPEPIRSQLNTAYATLLNLYRARGSALFDLYPKTFHAYQSHAKHREDGSGLMRRKFEMLERLGYLDARGLTSKGDFASSLFGYELFMGELYGGGAFEDLNEVKLNILLSGLIFEPRKGDSLPRLSDSHRKLQRMAEHYAQAIHRQESKFRIAPYTKFPHFHLAPAVEAWTENASFDKLFKVATVDEGEIVRHFRMIIQLLRELTHARHVSEKLRKTAAEARRRIDRDVVDAEKQLRV
ncbi:MAG: DEAD/DEAH box helicase [Candidatus Omnitrophota bacterium]